MYGLLVNVRNWCYQTLKARRGEEHAKYMNSFLFGVMLAPYYVAFFSAVALLQYKFGITPFFRRSTIFITIIQGLILFSPYVTLILWFLKSAPALETETSDDKAGLKILLVGVMGILMMFLVPSGLNLLIP